MNIESMRIKSCRSFKVDETTPAEAPDGAWLLADGAMVNLDQAWNEDDSKAELRGLVDSHRGEVKDDLERALAAKFANLDRLTEESVRDFRLRDR